MESVLPQLGKRLPAQPEPYRVLLTEGFDDRVVRATELLNAIPGISAHAMNGKDDRSTILEFLGLDAEALSACEENLYQRRKQKGITREEAQALLAQPLYLAAGLLQQAYCDTVVSGAVHTTADVIRAGLYSIDKAEGTKSITSTFFITLPDGRSLSYSDCGVIPSPDEAQLVEIGLLASKTHEQLTGEQARVAYLSFSTKGSASDQSITKIQRAVKELQSRAPELCVDGELQFDAAFVPEIARRKAPQSPLAGNANVFIFPDLASGNIAYKITERLGGAQAVGPLLRGFAKSWMDLSRGSTAEDIVLAAVCGLVLSRAG